MIKIINILIHHHHHHHHYNHNIIMHADMPKNIFRNLWKTIKLGKEWKGEIKNKTKNNGYYWVSTTIKPEYKNDKLIGYAALRKDITARKELELLSSNLENEIDVRTNEIKEEKQFVHSILNSQNNIVITTDGIHIQTVNNAFLSFYAITNIKEFTSKYGDCICDTFDKNSSDIYLKKIQNGQTWLEFIISNKILSSSSATCPMTSSTFSLKNLLISPIFILEINTSPFLFS